MPVGWSITQIWVKPPGIPQIWVNPQIWAITQIWGNHAQIAQNWVLHLFLGMVIYLGTGLIKSKPRLIPPPGPSNAGQKSGMLDHNKHVFV